MYKRKFGMACLNITQGRFGGYSHKNINAYDLAGMDAGIDRFVTFNDLKVIGVHEYSRTGFANTVCFFDEQNNVTIAMTHCNIIPNGCKVGKVYHLGETVYFEGTKGNATGNHIHLEIGKGYQSSKTKINGEWQLKDLINIEDYFYIDDEYTEVRDDCGYSFSHNNVQELKSGYQLINWNDKRVHVYKQTDDQEIGLMSAKGEPDYKAVETIDKIDDDHVHYCKVNCSYFEMANQAEYGLHYGVEQGFTMNLAPKNDGLICVYIDKFNNVHWQRSKDYYLNNTDVKCAFTPFCINLFDGEDVDDYSYNLGDKRKLSNTQTCLMQCADGKYALVVFEDKLTTYQTGNFAKEYGCTFNCCLDSGGSSQMIVNGSKIVYTERKIPNVLTLYKKENNSTSEEKPPLNECEECKKKDTQINNLKAEIAMIKEDYEKELSLVNKKNEALVKTNTSLGKELKDAYHEISTLKGYVD